MHPAGNLRKELGEINGGSIDRRPLCRRYCQGGCGYRIGTTKRGRADGKQGHRDAFSQLFEEDKAFQSEAEPVQYALHRSETIDAVETANTLDEFIRLFMTYYFKGNFHLFASSSRDSITCTLVISN